MNIDAKVLEELKAKHGELHELSSDHYAVVVRRPDRQVWRKFVDSAADERRRTDAIERLFLDCVVWPDLPTVSVMLDARPALAQQFGAEVAALASDGAVEKKAL